MDLQETSNLILANLGKFKGIRKLTEIKELMAGTSMEGQVVQYEDAIRFFQEHGKFPDQEYFEAHYPLTFTPPDVPFSTSIIKGFVSALRKESAQMRAADEIASGNLEQAHEILSDVRKIYVETKPFIVDDAIPAYAQLTEKPSGILMGVNEIDEVLKGCSYGNMGVIGAGPGMFKTTLGTSAAYNARKGGFNGIYFSLEIMARDVWFNLLSRHSAELGEKIVAEKLKKGLLSDEEQETLVRTVEDWKSDPNDEKGELAVLTSSDFPDFSFSILDDMWGRLDEQMGGLDYIIIDYIQLFSAFRPSRSDPRQWLNDLVRYFTDLSTSYKSGGLIVIILSQVNRDGIRRIGRTGRADLTMFADINSLEREAHWGIILFSSEQERLNNTSRVQIVKNRSGRVMADMVSVFVDPECFLMGASDFSAVFTEDSIGLLADTEGGGEDLFE